MPLTIHALFGKVSFFPCVIFLHFRPRWFDETTWKESGVGERWRREMVEEKEKRENERKKKDTNRKRETKRKKKTKEKKEKK